MQDNWYEAAVSAYPPNRIISVVDWASDAAPIPPGAPPAGAASYHIFEWGVNDPSESNRTIKKENYDSLSSPVGWHRLPFTNDPSFHGRVNKADGFYRNTSTTWGNNVRLYFSFLHIAPWFLNMFIGLCTRELGRPERIH